MLEKNIQSDLLIAMKNHDKFQVSVLRMLKSVLQNETINLKHELSDEEIIFTIKKQIKLKKDNIDLYRENNREDLALELEKEVLVLSKYVPRELSLDEITNNILEILKNYETPTIKDMGQIMAEAKKMMGTTADMSVVSKIIKEHLS